MLEDTERRVLRIRKEHFLRKESLKAIAHAKKVAAVNRPTSRERSCTPMEKKPGL